MKKPRKRKNRNTANRPKKPKQKTGRAPKIRELPILEKKAGVFKSLFRKLKKAPVYLRKKIRLLWHLNSLLIFLAAIPVLYFFYDRYFKSQYEKFEETHVQQGSLEFPPTNDLDTFSARENKRVINEKFYIDSITYHYPLIKGVRIENLAKKSDDELIYFNMGTNVVGFSKKQLYAGVNIFNSGLPGCTEEPVLIFAEGDRIYASAKFVDLRSGNEIGEMNFNHWKIYNGEFLDYHEGDDKFEVIDKQGNVVFSIANISTSSVLRIAISGYFNTLDAVLILNTQTDKETQLDRKTDINICISKVESDWLNKAMIQARKVKSVFPYLPGKKK